MQAQTRARQRPPAQNINPSTPSSPAPTGSPIAKEQPGNRSSRCTTVLVPDSVLHEARAWAYPPSPAKTHTASEKPLPTIFPHERLPSTATTTGPDLVVSSSLTVTASNSPASDATAQPSPSPHDGTAIRIPVDRSSRSLHVRTDVDRVEYWLPPASSARFLQFRVPTATDPPPTTSGSGSDGPPPAPDADADDSGSDDNSSPSVYCTALSSPTGSPLPQSPVVGSAPSTVQSWINLSSRAGVGDERLAGSPTDDLWFPVSDFEDDRGSDEDYDVLSLRSEIFTPPSPYSDLS
ncbi:hypothetical protein ONZ51_g3049 [Trametes cubensis]|uniref:Uncharacterized protein n=1 Tax=Trametes cubensis TaxID=1111947 RepID=A0AAD7XDD8_9APHY|nr:hypothetical protein ONZ51_g3049 [Trametes cubensis]